MRCTGTRIPLPMPPDILREAYYPNLQPAFPAEEVRKRIEDEKKDTVLDVDHTLRTLGIDTPDTVSLPALQEAYYRGRWVYDDGILRRINSFARETFTGIQKRSDLYAAAARLEDAFPEYLRWLKKIWGEEDYEVYRFRHLSCPGQLEQIGVPTGQKLFELDIDDECYVFQLEHFTDYRWEDRPGEKEIHTTLLTTRHATDSSKTFHLRGSNVNSGVSTLSYVNDPMGKLPDALQKEFKRIIEDVRRHVPEEEMKKYATGYDPLTVGEKVTRIWERFGDIFRGW